MFFGESYSKLLKQGLEAQLLSFVFGFGMTPVALKEEAIIQGRAATQLGPLCRSCGVELATDNTIV